MKMALSTALFVIFSGFAAGIHIHAPENIAAVAGNSVTMSCGTDVNQSFVMWHFQSVIDSKEMLIFNGEIGLSRFTINKNNFGLYHIRIENVTDFDAGAYRCVIRMHVLGGAETIAEFMSDLVVFESHPSCRTNASSVNYEGRVNDILLLCCTVDYTGNWSPYMEWSRHDGMNITTMYTIIQQNTSITSTVTLRLNPGDNSVTFTCKTAFAQATELKITQVRDAPTYHFIWNYTTSVLFGPQRIEITPRSESYSPNDKLYCDADGNPNPSCSWIDLDTNKEVAKECLLLIEENMRRDQKYNYQCRAENAIVGVRTYKSTNIRFRVLDQTDTSTLRQYSIIGGAVGIAAGSILISVIVTRIRKYLKQKCRYNTSKENSTEVPSSPHEYESIYDLDIQMNQLGRDPVTVIENIQENDVNEEDKEDGQEVESNVDTHPTPVNDVVNNSTDEVHSLLVTSENYSSLMATQIIQHEPAQYSQLGTQAAAVAEVNVGDERNDMVPSLPHAYYNLP